MSTPKRVYWQLLVDYEAPAWGHHAVVKTGFGKPRASRGATEKGAASPRVAAVPFRESAVKSAFFPPGFLTCYPRATDGVWPFGV